MQTRFHFLLLFVLTLNALTLTETVQAVSSDGSAVERISPDGLLNPDGTLKLDGSFSGEIDLSGWQVSLDAERGPVFSSTADVGGWQALQFGFSDRVYAITVDNTNVYVGGNFFLKCGNTSCNSGNTTLNNIAMWNGSAWQSMSYGVNGAVYAVAVSGSSVYVGGNFDRLCSNAACSTGNSANNIAIWNGASWASVGSGLDDTVEDIAISGNNVYVVGWFSEACGNTACNSGNIIVNHAARWFGNTWTPIGYGVSQDVRTIAVNGSDIYLGGNFPQVCSGLACTGGNITVNHIAKWSYATSTWSSLGNGLDAVVQHIALDNGNVYVGGAFLNTCADVFCNPGMTVNRIAKWNGGSWSSLGNGLNGMVYAIYPSNGKIFVGGFFNATCSNSICNAVGVNANHVAIWNGTGWSAPGNGLNGTVLTIAVNGNDFYAGGLFDYTCADVNCVTAGTAVNHIALFDINSLTQSSSFMSLGSNDGWLLESSETSGKGGTLDSTATLIYVGDNAQDKQYRSILSFNTAGLPDSAIITKVQVKIKVQGFTGGNMFIPTKTLGNLLMDIRQPYFGTNANLTVADFQSAASRNAVGVVGSISNTGWRTVTLKSTAYPFVNLTGKTQLRLRFQNDDNDDLGNDYLKIFSGDAPAASRPQLIISYYVP